MASELFAVSQSINELSAAMWTVLASDASSAAESFAEEVWELDDLEDRSITLYVREQSQQVVHEIRVNMRVAYKITSEIKLADIGAQLPR